MRGRRRVAVLGHNLPESLGETPLELLIGQTIQLRGIPFEVIGVLAEKGFLLEGEAGSYQRSLGTRYGGRLDGPSILPGSETSRCPPPLSRGRARNSSHRWGSVDGECHGGGVHRVAMEEVRRTV